MIPPLAQQPSAVLETLARLVPTLYGALEAATQAAKEFFAERDEEINPALYPNLVRYEAMKLLDASGHEVSEEAGFEREPVANNGLLLTYGAYHLRILKADDGLLPAPGISRARKKYYHQPSLFEEAVDFMNLVVLWEVSNGLLDTLMLVCPKGAGETKSSVASYWQVPIPHPALVATVSIPDAPPDDELGYSLADEALSDEALASEQLPHR